MHFRSNQKQMTNFMLNNQTVEKVSMCKYLGVYLDEHIKYDKPIEKMAESLSRALDSVITKFKSMKNASYTLLQPCLKWE